jgi:hypothetical protein
VAIAEDRRLTAEQALAELRAAWKAADTVEAREHIEAMAVAIKLLVEQGVVTP